MILEEVYEGGQKVFVVSIDLETGIITRDDGVETVTESASDDLIADILASVATDARRNRLDTAAATLRQWAADAEAVDVGPMTVAQHKAVTQTVVNRLGVFFDRFADLLDER